MGKKEEDEEIRFRLRKSYATKVYQLRRTVDKSHFGSFVSKCGTEVRRRFSVETPDIETREESRKNTEDSKVILWNVNERVCE